MHLSHAALQQQRNDISIAPAKFIMSFGVCALRWPSGPSLAGLSSGRISSRALILFETAVELAAGKSSEKVGLNCCEKVFAKLPQASCALYAIESDHGCLEAHDRGSCADMAYARLRKGLCTHASAPNHWDLPR